MGWKIVRDHDDVNCPPLGVSGMWRESADPVSGLVKKLHEELGEFAEERSVGELYDLQDVVAELLARLDPSGLLAKAHARKVADRGGFTRGLEWTPVPGGQEGR